VTPRSTARAGSSDNPLLTGAREAVLSSAPVGLSPPEAKRTMHTPSPSDLRAIPLLKGLTDDHLAALVAAFEHVELAPGSVLFEAGTAPTHLHILLAGEVALEERGEPRFVLTPIAPIGELGSVTGLERNTRAVTTQPSKVLRIGTAALAEFFEKHGDVAFPFYHNLLGIVADKVRRDTRRMEEMRDNLVRTQKAMKKLRDLVLEAEETPLSKQVCDTLEDLIEHNRRGHYLVEPAPTLTATVRLDDGTTLAVKALSRSAGAPAKGAHWSGVLVLPAREIPVSGTVESVDETVLVKLDLLIDEYAAALADYLTRVQMLDFVV
jgi:CRP-like cAMP-binding protein